MKKIIIPFFCAVLLSSTVSAQTATAVATDTKQSKLTPKDVIDNYIKALGGREKLEAVKSTIIENTISVQGMEFSMVTKKMGNKFKSTQTVMGQEMSQVFDGVKGYANQMGQKTEIPADKIAELKKSKTIDALGYDPANFKTVTVEKIDGSDYNVLTSDKGTFYFNAGTGLLHKSVAKEGTAVIKGYTTVDGIKFPSEIEAEGNGQKVTIKTTKVTLNPANLTDADFS